MSRVKLICFALALLVVLACGGGGGGGGTPTVGITIAPTSGSVPLGGSVNFTATVTGSTDTRATFTASAGSIVPTGDSTATWTAPGVAGSATITARAVADTSKTAVATFSVIGSGSTATVNGRVIDALTRGGVAGATVTFYRSDNTVAGTTTTDATGGFSAAVPTAAKRFHLVAAGVPSGYYKQYEFKTLRYSSLIADCTAPLPTLTTGGTVNLSVITLTSTNQPPPPPPNGCGG